MKIGQVVKNLAVGGGGHQLAVLLGNIAAHLSVNKIISAILIIANINMIIIIIKKPSSYKVLYNVKNVKDWTGNNHNHYYPRHCLIIIIKISRRTLDW